jgi:hypothetical protein
METTEILKARLLKLEAKINEDGRNKIQYHEQHEDKKNMSFTGGNGRLYVTPSSEGYDISLSGKLLQSQMYPFMRDLCGKECDGYKQTNQKIGKQDVLFWRIEDFALVVKAVRHYSKTE